MSVAAIIDFAAIQATIEEKGYCHLPSAGADALEDLLHDLGQVIQVTEVAVKQETARLVNSDQALDLHTDHHAADLIAWHCIEQSDAGGESVLLDAEAAYAQLTPGQQRTLGRIHLTEHKVFAGDPGTYPLVHERDGRRKFYYSFWLADENGSPEEEDESLGAFRQALDRTPREMIKLQADDILIIDNGRMLHGRTAIGGSKRRLLRRYWIATTQSNLTPKPGSPMSTAALVLPEPITPEQIRFLESRGIDPRVAALDLSMVKMKLQDPEEGKGWTAEQCDEAEVEYKRFLTLNLLHPRSIVPTTTMDTFWHYHILDTRAYHRDSEAIFGGYFHHFPYFGMRGEEDAQDLDQSFQNTMRLYAEAFGEAIVSDLSGSCKRDCQSRCWHACKSK
jgi:hypothetical protein